MFQLTREIWWGFSAQSLRAQISPDIFIIIFLGGSIFPERYPSLPMIYLGNLVNSIDTEFGQCNSVLGFQLFWPQRSVDKRAQY